ncbi:unnamed protein product, partial [Scytosiphon promiscuus]
KGREASIQPGRVPGGKTMQRRVCASLVKHGSISIDKTKALRMRDRRAYSHAIRTPVTLSVEGASAEFCLSTRTCVARGVQLFLFTRCASRYISRGRPCIPL